MKHLILMAALGLAACAKPDVVCQDFITGTGPDRLITFGDSQSAGHATENSIMCGHSWANDIAVDHDLRLTNLAVAGTNFVSSQEFDSLVDFQYRPTDRVMGLAGFNDMNNFGADPAHLALFRSAIAAAILKVAPQVKSLTIGTCLVPHAPAPRQTPAAIAAYRQAVVDVANQLNLPNVFVVDHLNDDFASDPSYYVADDIHLSLKGQDVIHQRMESGGGL